MVDYDSEDGVIEKKLRESSVNKSVYAVIQEIFIATMLFFLKICTRLTKSSITFGNGRQMHMLHMYCLASKTFTSKTWVKLQHNKRFVPNLFIHVDFVVQFLGLDLYSIVVIKTA